MNRTGISLFSSSGIGDLGLKANNISTVIGNELLSDRSMLFSANYPTAKMFQGDIWQLKDSIVSYYQENYNESPFIILATPPCQGMSSNGMGKILSDIRKGVRPKFDERNSLIIPTIDIVERLQPEWIILENVPNMNNTVILDEQGNPVNIIDYVFTRLKNYVGISQVVNTADYGIPQIRKRLITILTRTTAGKKYFNKYRTFIPIQTHSEENSILYSPWITLRQAIGELPTLDAVRGANCDTEFNPLHRVAIMDPKKYVWVKYTKEGDSAFNNQCINPECLFQGNSKHGTTRVDGINQANKNTPLFCEKCGTLLPRPYTEDINGNKQIMKGFISAYKRMEWDKPASTLTMNFPYISSDNKIHPSQNRPLSIYEATVIQTISDYDYKFEINNKTVGDNLIIESIGESVPPRLIDTICSHIINDII